MNSSFVRLWILCCALLVWPVAFADSSCPAWEEVLSRNGSDGGQLTIELDTCEVFGYVIQSFPQSDGIQSSVDLLPDDIIIVWDEDSGHGELEANKNFIFTGSYIADPNSSIIQLRTTDPRTNWAIYKVTEGGLFTKAQERTNEHEVIHFYDLTLEKIDDVNDLNCRSPGEEITYTICYENISKQALDNIVMIDWLPPGVTYPAQYELIGDQYVCSDPNYNSQEHYYIWDLGSIDPNESGCVQLTVLVNELSTPMGNLHNEVEIWDDESLLVKDTYDTRVCCWGGSTIYVDKDAPGLHTGTSWEMAYLDLKDALGRAALGCGNEIHLADGIYQPGLDTSASFEIPDGVLVYGGYAGYRPGLDEWTDPNEISDPNTIVPTADPNERNWKLYPTILNGYIGENDYGSDIYNYIVVMMGHGSLLDGVTVEEGVRGVDGSGVASNVTNCIIKKNLQRGIYVENGDMTVAWSDISENGFQGIHHLGDGYELFAEHCSIHDNQYDGIRTVSSDLTLFNSLIYRNGFDASESYYGVNMLNPLLSPLLRNNTVVQNAKEGIRLVGGPLPEIKNCIIYYNNDNQKQLAGIDPDSAAFFSCIADCNDWNNNYSGVPGFAYMAEPNVPVLGNYHLAFDSPCIDVGDSNDYPQETDIDGEPRVFGDMVDIGADEAYSCSGQLTESDIYNALDFSADGLVNNSEFALFAAAWLSHDPNDPVCDPNHADYISDPNAPTYITMEQKQHWNPSLNFDETDNSMYAIDLGDLEMLWNNWLWIACWKQQHIETYGMMFGSIPMSVPKTYDPLQSLNAVISTDEEYALRE